MTKLIIKRARIKDAGKILEIQKLAFQSEAEIHQKFTIPPLVQTIDSIREDFLNFHFYKAVLNGRIVGSVKVRSIDDNSLLIGRLVVHPDYQSMGIGKQLMQFIENAYRNATSYILFTAEKSLRNVNFYTHLGYKITGNYTEPGHSDIILVRLQKINPVSIR
jgi:ribosomal protein S18 acetylase RimI-like enzyme